MVLKIVAIWRQMNYVCKNSIQDNCSLIKIYYNKNKHINLLCENYKILRMAYKFGNLEIIK